MNSCVDSGRPWSGRQKGGLSTVVARGFQRVNVERVAVLTHDLVICKDSNDCLGNVYSSEHSTIINFIIKRMVGKCSSSVTDSSVS